MLFPIPTNSATNSSYNGIEPDTLPSFSRAEFIFGNDILKERPYALLSNPRRYSKDNDPMLSKIGKRQLRLYAGLCPAKAFVTNKAKLTI